MRKLVVIVVLFVSGYLAYQNQFTQATLSGDEQAIAEAFANQVSNLRVRGEGTVTRLLPDDNEGSRHQRFIVELASGHTVLLSHNIDLAPRIDALQQGDQVSFYGEYEWNPQGGVVHWTHHDPAGRHPGGWIEHEGTRYE